MRYNRSLDFLLPVLPVLPAAQWFPAVPGLGSELTEFVALHNYRSRLDNHLVDLLDRSHRRTLSAGGDYLWLFGIEPSHLPTDLRRVLSHAELL